MIVEFEGFQLSAQQKRLWRLQQNNSCIYSAFCAVQIEGNLHIENLKAAVNQVIKTHEILRTNYRFIPGMDLPLQFITDLGACWQEHYNISNYNNENQNHKLERLFSQFRQQKFDLEEGSILRLSLIELSLGKYILLIALPALCADKTTLNNLVKEIHKYYTAISSQKEVTDVEPLQYADFAAWQNELLTSDETKAGRDYWRPLTGYYDFSALTALQLPYEKQVVAQVDFNPQSYCLKLDTDITEKIVNFAQVYHGSVKDFLLTCWNILLWRFTGQENIIVGAASDGRKYQELKSACGLISKYLPVNIYIKEFTFIELWQQIKTTLSNIGHYEDYFDLAHVSLKEITDWSTCFEYDIQYKYKNEDISFTIYQQNADIDRYKVKLACNHQENLLKLEFYYDANLFLLEDIQRLENSFNTLLLNAITSPNKKISELKIVSDIERQQLICGFNNNQVNYNKDKCIQQLFEEQVAKNPDKIAIIFEQEKLTYTELNSRANQIARYLRQLGVGSEVLVGLCVERSPLIILGILAILKAGGAYVPLDPAYPQERLAFMLQNSQPSVLLTQTHLIDQLPEHGAQVVCIDATDLTAHQIADNLNNDTSCNNLAYIIYTSGSTGTPKGVRISHANLCHYVQAMQRALGIKEQDIYLHTASLAFSSSVRQLIMPLTQGATVKIATSEQRQDPIALFQGIKQDNVTVIDIVPSYWRNCNQTLAVTEFKNALLDNKLRLIVSASEPLLSDIPANWTFGLQHNASLINMFGQTETCGIVAVYPISVEQDEQAQVIPLGQPIANTQIYILDKHLQPVPIGVAGELYIGGWGVGQGYLHRPDLTAEKFIPNPFSNEPGARLYKTGDLGRYLSDGTIEFIGRSDHQVKIRGFRIELAEIEVALTQHPHVDSAVVTVREDETGNKYLVAYVVPVNIEVLNWDELNNFLRGKLPDYMLPSTFVTLDALPLTPNGKLNRQGLPAPEQVVQNAKTTITAPRTPVEEVLAGIWQKVLGVRRVGIDENFFNLGGHSLSSTQVMSQVRQAFRVELPLRSLFEAPTIAEFAPRIEAALRDGQQRDGQQLSVAIERVTRDGNLPLSFAQQRLWFLEQLQPETSAYNLFKAVRLQGKLDVAALEQSFNEIIHRHEALRTVFEVVNGQPIQVIVADASIKLTLIDIRHLSPENREAETQKLAQIQAKHAFDLSTAPLLNIKLVQVAEQEYVLLLTMHHIIADGWSAGVILRELANLYESFCTGKPCLLPDLPIQYADFAVWQRRWLEEALAPQMEYWKQQLSGNLPVLELPIAKARPKNQTFVGKKQSFELSPTLTVALKALSQQENVTLFMTLLAGFQTLLYRYTGQEDILVGSPIANRNRKEIEELIGFFVNTVVLRTQFASNLSFRDLLKQVREVTLGAYANQDLPFELLVEALQPERNLSYTPLFQVMFALRNTPMEALKLPGLSLDYLEVESGAARFDLSLTFTESNQGLVGELEYNTDLFDAASMTRMLQHLGALLENIVSHPEKSLSELPILTQTEQQQVLVEWNQTQADLRCVCVHQLFATQVECTPNAIAVVDDNQQLTYQQLNHKANQLAHYLRKMGVGREVVVGICCERTVEMVIGLLGILKAGGAYIPLDPTYPQERLAFMLEDSQISVLLTQQQLLKSLPPHQAQIVCIDDWGDIAAHPINNPDSNVTSENLIYTIYTSGSTGKPKGVQITHRSVVNFLTAMQQQLGLSNQDSLLSVTTLSFDIAVLELFLPLTVGAKVILASREVAIDGTQLLKRIKPDVTVMQATPATWRMLLEAGWQSNPQLKILCGGEALPVKLAQQLRQRSAAVWNLYGPTETTIWSTIHQVDERETSLPIGRPIANTQIYILDGHLQPVPVGVSGELYIGGAGLARGYFNRPELTTEKFIPNPFNNKETLYRTGDLARYLANGEIEYLGRIDYQVKLRGFRIELGEIEAVLEEHPAVRQSVVIVREDIPGDQRLVAYLVGSQVSSGELRQYLRQKLPEYMIPTAFIMLDVMPMTPNGKVNRQALPVPENTNLESASTFIAPRNWVEEALAEIWRQTLNIAQVSIYDNFFDLGGHSLLATQVISRIRNRFEVDIPLQCLFASPTIAELAEHIQLTDKKVTVIERTSRDCNLPCSFAQARLWLLEQLNPGSCIYNMPFSVSLVGNLNIRVLEQSINEIIRRHEVLRTTFSFKDGQLIQTIIPSLNIKLPVLDLRELPLGEREAVVQKLSIEEFRRPFDLSQVPLLRCTLLRVGEEEHIALFTIHHIVFDGWSTGVLIKELAALYEASLSGKTSSLPELPIQYADFAAWQRQHLQENTLQSLLNYWQQQLGNNLPVLKLPTIRPRAEVKTNLGACQSFLIPLELTDALRSLSRQCGVTLFMTLLAGFQVLLQRYTNQDDIVVGTDVANRKQVEVERLIGFFVNLLVLRTDLSGNPTVRELLQKVRTCTLGAYEHQDLPFDELVKALQPERNLSNVTPLFQVLFVLQNTPTSALALSGLKLSLLEVENKIARFDLGLFLTETDQGIEGKWQYNADLFDADTIISMTNHWQTLLNSIASQPHERINALEMLAPEEKEKQIMQKSERKASKRDKFIKIIPKAVSLSADTLIQTNYLKSGDTFPLVIQPHNQEIDLITWVENEREYIETELLKHGAILFRGFPINSASEFEKVAQAISPNLFAEYGDLPRAVEGNKVYGSTPYPADKAILFHNESSHLHSFPLKIWFFCVQPALQGGETPIVDCRKAYQALSPKLRDKLAQKQLMYVRHFTNGLDVSWQDFFKTTDKTVVENYCSQAEIEFEWYGDDNLLTRQIRPALRVHPKTGEPIFFNQVQLHHISYLDVEVRKSLLSIFGEEKLPRNVYYGDGTVLEDSAIAEINQVYQQSKTSFGWHKGDILMLDNMLVAHGRNSYAGERKILVAMAEMIYSAD